MLGLLTGDAAGQCRSACSSPAAADGVQRRGPGDSAPMMVRPPRYRRAIKTDCRFLHRRWRPSRIAGSNDSIRRRPPTRSVATRAGRRHHADGGGADRGRVIGRRRPAHPPPCVRSNIDLFPNSTRLATARSSWSCVIVSNPLRQAELAMAAAVIYDRARISRRAS